mmetsp:Transcript_7479/g.12477  ORF Transcript_7479/g.12477 Transcript_7479/m.12477 type:complete len:248 (+) Transcript_7479:201-944(+)
MKVPRKSGTGLGEEGNNRAMVVLEGIEDGVVATKVDGVNLGAVADQKKDDVAEAKETGDVQRGLALSVKGIHTGTRLDEVLRDQDAPKHGGPVEGCAVGAVADGGRGTAVEEKTDDGTMAPEDGDLQGCFVPFKVDDIEVHARGRQDPVEDVKMTTDDSGVEGSEATRVDAVDGDARRLDEVDELLEAAKLCGAHETVLKRRGVAELLLVVGRGVGRVATDGDGRHDVGVGEGAFRVELAIKTVGPL